MEGNWIKVAYLGNSWADTTIYVDPDNERAKLYETKVTKWSYHDECETDEFTYLASIEQALELVYPDETAISNILRHTKNDYTEHLNKLKADYENKKRS